MLPYVLQLVQPRSVLDVGCGVGTWLRACLELGIDDVTGIDGDYVDRSMLHISAERFVPMNLEKPFDLRRRFDLAMSLEVAEHLPPSSAEGFVKSLVKAAPVVLMSAAIPGQGGVSHLNERWQDYWVNLFEQHNYQALDTIRSRMWDREDVQPFYSQNAFLYISRELLETRPELKELASTGTTMPLRVVHPKAYSGLWNWTHTDNISLRAATRQWKHSAKRAVLRRLGRPIGPTNIAS
ncbi:MAG TPA: class I SAM-dependent methyltransferase [Tepidisphaeraceae bacterium]|nr:class I SAM-dependent methyltransferase [Tepidisphaeraceae bacterium]